VNSLSPLEVGQVVNSKDTLYEALVRNQVHCPKYKDLIMTTEFMQRVQRSESWLPSVKEIKLLNCFGPPPKQAVAEILYNLMINTNNEHQPEWQSAFIDTAQRIRKTPPDVKFMLAIISSMDQNNKLFAKDYVKPRLDLRGNDLLAGNEQRILDPNNFFTGLPLARKSKKRSISFLDAKMKQAIQIRKMEQ